MALQSPFFGKRDIEPAGSRTVNPSSTPGPVTRHTPLATAYAPTVASGSAAAPSPNPPAAPSKAPSTPASSDNSSPQPGKRPGTESLLKVGPLIRLKGVEITDCDTLFVEGTVEATMDSRVMEIAPPGRFKGAAEVDIADIHGHFDGALTVRERLVVHPTGRVTGTVRYSKLSIAEGGQLSGDVGLLTDGPTARALSAHASD